MWTTTPRMLKWAIRIWYDWSERNTEVKVRTIYKMLTNILKLVYTATFLRPVTCICHPFLNVHLNIFSQSCKGRRSSFISSNAYSLISPNTRSFHWTSSYRWWKLILSSGSTWSIQGTGSNRDGVEATQWQYWPAWNKTGSAKYGIMPTSRE